jgi:hypothetical protein
MFEKWVVGESISHPACVVPNERFGYPYLP